MAKPKAYIYEFEKVKAIVCSYSLDLFNIVIKTARSDCEIYSKEIDMISHKVYNKSSCNCKDTVKDISSKLASKLKTFEKAVIPLEFLELERGNSHLLICEVYRNTKRTGCKFAVINTTMLNKRDSNTDIKIDDSNPKYCLLRLHSIFSHDLAGFSDSIGRNNSLSSKSPAFKSCYKEIARELATKGALPSDISQKCLHSRDTNRCWFDYGKIMDICIHCKVTAKDIAEIIKEIAAVDPMQPDPVMCIKGRLGMTSHRGATHSKKTGAYSDNSDVLSVSQSSSEKTGSSSSSASEMMVCKLRSPNGIKPKSYRGRCVTKKKTHHSVTRSKSISRETQTLNCTQSETQTDSLPCHCYRRTGNAKLTPVHGNDGSMNKYLWTPNLYDCNDQEDLVSHYNDYMDEPIFFDEENQYSHCPDADRELNYDRNDGKRFPSHTTGSLDDPGNYRNGDYDSRIYEDFMRNSDYLDRDDDVMPNCIVDESQFYGAPNKDYANDGTRKRVNSINARLQPSLKFHLKAPANNSKSIRYANCSNSADALRSSSQPMLQTKNQNCSQIDSANCPQNRCSQQSQIQIKTVPISKTAVDSGTQTLAPSPNISFEDGPALHLKKSASEGNILGKTSYDKNGNNSSRDSCNALSNVGVNTYISLNTSKTFKMEAVQTDLTENGYFSPERKYESLIPKYIYARGIESCSSTDSNPRQPSCPIPPLAKTSRQHKSSVMDDRHISNKLIFDDSPFNMNRNDNNHSISRSPSSRNSQIVEVDNENMEKISSVIVDQDSRPIIYFPGRDQYMDQSPFYERGQEFSEIGIEKQNTNINNSIRTVTVSNRDPCSNKCSVPGCRNVAEDFTCKCETHSVLSSQSCSPERCISRLTCILALNRQIVGGSTSPEMLTQQNMCLRQILNASCNSPRYVESFIETTNEPIKSTECKDGRGNANLKSLGEQYVRNSADGNDLCLHTRHHHLYKNEQPLHSALKLSHDHFSECLQFDTGSSSIKQVSQTQNPAQLFYQSEPMEQVTAMHTIPILDCANADVTPCQNELNIVSSLCSPLSNIGVSSTPNLRGQDCVSAEPSEYKIWNARVAGSRNDTCTNESEAQQNHQNKCHDNKSDTNTTIGPKPYKHSIDRLTNSCNLKFPINFQICPVSGCRNITTTGFPPCFQLDCDDYYTSAPEKNQEIERNFLPHQGFEAEPETRIDVNQRQPFPKYTPVSDCKENRVIAKNPSKVINHGEIHEYDNSCNDEIIFNDSIDGPSKHVSIPGVLNVLPPCEEINVNEVIAPLELVPNGIDSSFKSSQQSFVLRIHHKIRGTRIQDCPVVIQVQPETTLLTYPDNSLSKRELKGNNFSQRIDISGFYSEKSDVRIPTENLNLEGISDISLEPINKNVDIKRQSDLSLTTVYMDPTDRLDSQHSIRESRNLLSLIREESTTSNCSKGKKPSHPQLTDDNVNVTESNNIMVKVEFNESKIRSPSVMLDDPCNNKKDNEDIIVVDVTTVSPRESETRVSEPPQKINSITTENHESSSVKKTTSKPNDTKRTSTTKQSSIKSVSSSSRPSLQPAIPCGAPNDLYGIVVTVPVSPRNSKKSSISSNVSEKKQSLHNEKKPSFTTEKKLSLLTENKPSILSERQPSMMIEKKPSVNNSSFYNYNSNNDRVTMDYLYLDCLTTKVRSRIFSDTMVFKDPDYLLLGKCDNMFYSTPELILNKHSNHILVSERWDIHSDLVLENLDNITESVPALVDHPNDKMILLISLTVYFLFCKQLPVLMHIALLPTKIKKSKINRLLKSIRHSKSHQQSQDLGETRHSKITSSHKFEKLELIKNFKNKMAKIISKCRASKLAHQDKHSRPSAFSINALMTEKRGNSLLSLSGDDECVTSQSTFDTSECTICTRSCNNLLEDVTAKKCVNDFKHWNSEPILHRCDFIRTNNKHLTRQRLMFTPSEISTSDLSMLCVEVLKKMNDKCIIDRRMGDEISTDYRCGSATISESLLRPPPSGTSKDTLKLIIKALKYLHRSQLDDSGPSNKTLDSVSSIKTCSEDRLESIKSLRQRIVRPKQNNHIVISAYNKIV